VTDDSDDMANDPFPLSSVEAVPDVPDMPDLSGRIVRMTAKADRARHSIFLRLGLALVGAFTLASAVSDLSAGHGSGADVHAARHLGAFTAAYGAGLLVVAVRPARARTMLPVSVVLGAALLITAGFDVAEGHVPLIGESTHLPELASVVLLWLLARPYRFDGTVEPEPVIGPRHLHPVHDSSPEIP